MSRPKITITPDQSDRLLDYVGWVALLLLIAVPLYYYGDLPEVVPRHFNLQGEPDGYSHKTIMWVLPALGGAMFLGMRALYPYPHLFNYPVTITPENAERQYRGGVKLLRAVNTLAVTMFAYLTYATIQVALGRQQGIGNLATLLFVAGIFGLLAYYWYQANRNA